MRNAKAMELMRILLSAFKQSDSTACEDEKVDSIVNGSILHILRNIETAQDNLNFMANGVFYSNIVSKELYESYKPETSYLNIEALVINNPNYKLLREYFENLGYAISHIPSSYKGNMFVIYPNIDSFARWMKDNEYTIDQLVHE